MPRRRHDLHDRTAGCCDQS